MSLDLKVLAGKNKTIGTKQTLKAVNNDQANTVFIAENADQRVLQSLIEKCQEKKVEIKKVENMEVLGEACGIEVPTASAAVIKD